MNQPPYLLAIDLFDDVRFELARTSVDHVARRVTIDIPKALPSAWPTLASAAPEDERVAVREIAAREKAEFMAQVRPTCVG